MIGIEILLGLIIVTGFVALEVKKLRISHLLQRGFSLSLPPSFLVL